MKLTFVTPRYGADVIGGAEMGVRLLAEHLATLPGWTVEVLTTCATDAWTWANASPAGATCERGVNVQRFTNAAERDADFRALTVRLLARPEEVDDVAARDWIDRQGPRSPALIDAVAATDADLVAFSPYLYHPTVVGLDRVPGRAVLHPAAHDEPAIRLPLLRDVFARADGLAFYSEGERATTQQFFPEVTGRPQIVVGLGIDEPPVGAVGADPGIAALDGRPYLVCLGRVDHSKGAHLLVSWFTRYKQRRPGPLALVVAGPVQRPVPEHPDVIQTGAVSESTKWALLSGARLLVSPSAYESFSLVVFEAWAAGAAVLVNGRCEPTREAAERSGGGLWFDSYAVFEASLDRLLADDGLRARLAAAGARYAGHYHWPLVIDRYRRFAEHLASTLRSRG